MLTHFSAFFMPAQILALFWLWSILKTLDITINDKNSAMPPKIITSSWLFLLTLSLSAIADPKFEIGGLVVDQTLSRVGHLFYEELLNGWDVPDGMNTLTIRERPDNIVGNTIWIEVDDNIVFEDKVGSRPSGIEEKAQTARDALEIYLQQHKEALRGLEGF